MTSLDVNRYKNVIENWEGIDPENVDLDRVGWRSAATQRNLDDHAEAIRGLRHEVSFLGEKSLSGEQETIRQEAKDLAIDISRAYNNLQSLFISLDELFALSPYGSKINEEEALSLGHIQELVTIAITKFLMGIFSAVPIQEKAVIIPADLMERADEAKIIKRNSSTWAYTVGIEHCLQESWISILGLAVNLGECLSEEYLGETKLGSMLDNLRHEHESLLEARADDNIEQ